MTIARGSLLLRLGNRFVHDIRLYHGARLSTGDRMHAWGQVKGCLFCGEPNETTDHLFFASPYTYTLWLEAVGTLLGRSPDPDWEETLAHLATHGFERLTYLLLRLVFQTTFYIIWRERETIEGIIKDLVKSGSWLNSLGRQ
ncbi:uncharacterized protein LOC106378395 [Brassica napus]|uniref:uncharacterized protein LOC106297401 n=1 Tax=Brassica oleracea var. oleracea TaxID=109376 RepID=UPI0006A6A949|nr:PREDICTED: uncharacterized protein LOC106297401 [Brassica oleracea var. oleracea]XP_013673984.1 uncharacterized protein LOC106378395 [Brassica napus]